MSRYIVHSQATSHLTPPDLLSQYYYWLVFAWMKRRTVGHVTEQNSDLFSQDFVTKKWIYEMCETLSFFPHQALPL